MLLQARVSTPPVTIQHHHYNYSFKFNNVSLNCTSANCNLKEQIQLSEAQKSLKFNQLIDKGSYLAYHGKKCCITANTMNTERASAAKMTRNFPCKIIPLNQVLQQPSPTAYISEKDVLDIFHPDVISTSTVKKSFDEVTNRLDMIVYGALSSALSGTSSTTVTNDLAKELIRLKEEVQLKSMEISTQHSRKIMNELPITGWLHRYLSHTLDSLGFIVDTQAKLTKPTAPVNEYAYSQPDLLIYHSQRFLVTLSALSIKVVCPHIDILCATQDIVEIDKLHMIAMAGEVKVESAHEDAVNECFMNMFGQATNLAMKAISDGNLVTKITMYGIVVAARKPDEAKLLHLLMNFENNTCEFKLVANCYQFTPLLNGVLEELSI